MRRFISKVLNVYINWHWALVSVMLVLGIILMFIYNQHKLDEIAIRSASNPGWAKFTWAVHILPLIGVLGKTILAGGFLAFFLKSFQFIGIFRDEISKVVLGEDFLTKTTFKYKRLVWENTTKSLYQSSFPEISNKVTDIIYKKYIPSDIDFHIEDAIISYELEYLDENHIAIIENQSFTINSTRKGTPFKWSAYITREDSGADKGDIKVLDFTINNKNVAAKDIKSADKKSGGTITRTISYEKQLKGKSQYFIKRSMKTVQSTKLNVFWTAEIHRYTKGFTLILRKNSLFEVDLIPFGLNIDLRKVPYTEVYTHRGVLIPGEGYVIVVKKKAH